MRIALNTTQLLEFTQKFGEDVFQDFDLSNIVLRTGGNDAMYYDHSKTGYGFTPGQRMQIQGKKDYDDYDSINPWFNDLIGFAVRNGCRDILYTANVLLRSYSHNKTPLNTFHYNSDVNVIGTELGNELYLPVFDMSFYRYLNRIEPYINNPMFGPVAISAESKGGYGSNGYQFRKYADSVIDLVEEEDWLNEPKISLHAYFTHANLTSELNSFANHVNEIKQRTDRGIWLTEVNIKEGSIKTITNDQLWDAWVQMYDKFEELGIELVGHHNLATDHGTYSLITKQGVKTKSDGTPLIKFFIDRA